MKKIDIVLALIAGLGIVWLFFDLTKDFLPHSFFFIFLKWFLIFLIPLLTIGVLALCRIIARRYLFVFQLVKFCLVGTLALLIDLWIFNLLGFFFGTTIIATNTQLFFKGISFLIATFAKFWGQKFWTFEKMEKKEIKKEIIQFFIITIIGLIINIEIFSLILNNIIPQLGFSLNTGKTISVLAAGLIVAFWNFLGYKFLVFKK